MTIKTQFSSFALADQLSMLDERLLVTLGARFQNIQDKSYAYGGGSRTANYDDHALTPSLGALYKLTPSVSLFANYIEGLQKGGVAPANDGSGNPVANAAKPSSRMRRSRPRQVSSTTAEALAAVCRFTAAKSRWRASKGVFTRSSTTRKTPVWN